MKQLKYLLIKIINKSGINITRSSPPKIILEYLSKLQPIITDVIRVGGPSDGGYFIPNDLEGVTAAFSPGSNGLWNFEKELGEVYQVKSFIIDKAHKAPLNLTKMQSFRPGLLGPANLGEVITLESWVNSSVNLDDNDLILQMDIEGAEYISILATPEYVLKRFRIVVIEFHNLNWLYNYPYFKNCVAPVFEKMLKHFEVVSSTANNAAPTFKILGIDFPQVIEVSFLRKDRVTPVLKQLNNNTRNLFKNDPEKKIIEINWKAIDQKLDR